MSAVLLVSVLGRLDVLLLLLVVLCVLCVLCEDVIVFVLVCAFVSMVSVFARVLVREGVFV